MPRFSKYKPGDIVFFNDNCFDFKYNEVYKYEYDHPLVQHGSTAVHENYKTQGAKIFTVIVKLNEEIKYLVQYLDKNSKLVNLVFREEDLTQSNPFLDYKKGDTVQFISAYQGYKEMINKYDIIEEIDKDFSCLREFGRILTSELPIYCRVVLYSPDPSKMFTRSDYCRMLANLPVYKPTPKELKLSDQIKVGDLIEFKDKHPYYDYNIKGKHDIVTYIGENDITLNSFLSIEKAIFDDICTKIYNISPPFINWFTTEDYKLLTGCNYPSSKDEANRVRHGFMAEKYHYGPTWGTKSDSQLWNHMAAINNQYRSGVDIYNSIHNQEPMHFDIKKVLEKKEKEETVYIFNTIKSKNSNLITTKI